MSQLGGDSIAEVFFQEEMALQGSSRSQAGRGMPVWPGREWCPWLSATAWQWPQHPGLNMDLPPDLAPPNPPGCLMGMNWACHKAL